MADSWSPYFLLSTIGEMTSPAEMKHEAAAIAPIPFAFVSFLSSSFVIYYLLFRKRQELERMHHRLVLAMNVAILINSSTLIWAPFAVPAGTPYFWGATGTTQTCTANGACHFEAIAVEIASSLRNIAADLY